MDHRRSACRLGDWKMKDHDGCQSIHNNHDGKIKYRCYKTKREYESDKFVEMEMVLLI